MPTRLGKIHRWRYLDSLDSKRYSKKEFYGREAEIDANYSRARIEVMATLLLGNGIRITGNQLVDSYGFIQIGSEIVTSAVKFYNHSESTIAIPIQFRYWDYPNESGGGERLRDPFFFAAHLFSKNGLEKPNESQKKAFFELSAWSSTWENPEIRDVIASDLEKNFGINPSNITSLSAEEQYLADRLVTLLRFFKNNPGLIEKSSPTGKLREDMALYITGLTKEKIEQDAFFKGLLESKPSEKEDRLERIMDIVNVFVKLNEKGVLKNRTAIKNYLENEEIGKTESLQGEVRVAVLRTYDSIYNYSNFVSTKAHQDNHSEGMPRNQIWDLSEASYALSQWVREKFEKEQKQSSKLTTNLDLSVGDKLSPPDVKTLSYRSAEADTRRKASSDKALWDAFFYKLENESYTSAKTQYFNSLNSFRLNKLGFESREKSEITDRNKRDLRSSAEECKQKRLELIEQIKTFLPEGYKINPHDHKVWLEIHRERTLVTDRTQHSENDTDASDTLICSVELEDFTEDYQTSTLDNNAKYAGETASSDKSTTGDHNEIS